MDFFPYFVANGNEKREQQKKGNLKLGNKSEELNDEFHFAYAAIVYFEMLSLQSAHK